MCGIVGYAGSLKAFDVLKKALKKLEYRGYDSAGIAVLNEKISFVKGVGRVEDVVKSDLEGKIGIAHTRWATHGKVSKENAHPQFDCSGKIAVVHNGIIENFQEIKKELIEKGHIFSSQTDTEVIAHLIEENLKIGPFSAFKKAVSKLKGSYAIAALIFPERKIFFARNKSPLILGISKLGNFIASDFSAFLHYTNKVVFVGDGEMGFISGSGFYIEKNGEKVEKEIKIIEAKPSEISKKGFQHFMLKEIFEQQEAIDRTLASKDLVDFARSFEELDKINFVAAGTSYHASLAFKYASRLPVEAILASEFRQVYRQGDIVAISQSGETADTLEAVRYAKRKGAKALAIVNVFGSTLARISDRVFYTKAGIEVGVAATKTFLAQLSALYAINSILEGEELPKFSIKEALKLSGEMRKLAAELVRAKSMFYIGRGPSYVTALEGALKMKEIAYLHAEAYAGGELKHGPLALIEENVPVVAICPNDDLREKMISNIEEVKARGGFVIAFGEKNDKELKSVSDRFYGLSEIDKRYSPLLYIVPLQLLAYHTAVLLGRDPDKPRNLAKSVTVE